MLWLLMHLLLRVIFYPRLILSCSKVSPGHVGREAIYLQKSFGSNAAPENVLCHDRRLPGGCWAAARGGGGAHSTLNKRDVLSIVCGMSSVKMLSQLASICSLRWEDGEACDHRPRAMMKGRSGALLLASLLIFCRPS
jgi:hypothetical protein